jgi:formylglycine-generating enzyme required for sulfatase activity
MTARSQTRAVLLPALGLGLLALGGCATGPSTSATAAVARSQGAVFAECSGCPEMVVVPAGSFEMGSPEDEPSRDPDEGLHEVTFARPFAVAKTHTTWDQWMLCVQDGACDGAGVETALRTGFDGAPIQNYRDHGRGTRPVVGVSWYDAQRYVGWLNAKTGTDAYRLLSESEWEYAARAGTTTAFPWGEEASHDRANFGLDDGEGLGGKAEGRDVWVMETAPVASFDPNVWGLYDMPGNIYEWVEDCYQADVSLLPTDGSAAKDGNCANRMMRSVSFESNPENVRVANRAGVYAPTLRGRNYLGFRVARTLD